MTMSGDVMEGEELLWDYGDLYWKLLKSREKSASARAQAPQEGEFFAPWVHT